MTMVDDAAQLAENLVGELGNRWRHVQAVAARARELADAVPEPDQDTLAAAAWLHDIGYSPEIGHTRFHPLDGARYLKSEGWPTDIVNLVAHHSGARFEAQERGLATELSEFPHVDTPTSDALAAADLTTGPTGKRVTYEERITEILTRYPPDHVVHRAWLRATPIIEQALVRTERRLIHQPM